MAISLRKVSPLAAVFFSNILAGVAGITSDANSLVNYARTAAQKHLFTCDEEIPVEMLAQRLCDLKQGYTQYGGKSKFDSGVAAKPKLTNKPWSHQVFDLSVYLYCTSVMTPFMGSSCITLIRQATTPAGRLLVSVRTTRSESGRARTGRTVLKRYP